MAEEINKTYTSNSLYNDSTGVIAFAEQLKQELINWANYQHVTEELGQNRPDLQSELNNLFLSVYERFLTFLNDADASKEAINTWKEIENFLADYTDDKTLASIIAELNNKIESRLAVPLESTTGSSTTSTMTQKAITETIDASKTFTTGEKVDNVGIDDEPTAGSENLVKSGGIEKEMISIKGSIKKSITYTQNQAKPLINNIFIPKGTEIKVLATSDDAVWSRFAIFGNNSSWGSALWSIDLITKDVEKSYITPHDITSIYGYLINGTTFGTLNVSIQWATVDNNNIQDNTITLDKLNSEDFDNIPTENSNKLIKSGTIYNIQKDITEDVLKVKYNQFTGLIESETDITNTSSGGYNINGILIESDVWKHQNVVIDSTKIYKISRTIGGSYPGMSCMVLFDSNNNIIEIVPYNLNPPIFIVKFSPDVASFAITQRDGVSLQIYECTLVTKQEDVRIASKQLNTPVLGSQLDSEFISSNGLGWNAKQTQTFTEASGGWNHKEYDFNNKLHIFPGQKYNVRITSDTAVWSRFAIYTDSFSGADSHDNLIKNTSYEFTAVNEITFLNGFLIEGTTAGDIDIEVFVDGEQKNMIDTNHIYDEAVTLDKLSSIDVKTIETGKNKLDLSKVLDGKYINFNTGGIGSWGEDCATDFIKVESPGLYFNVAIFGAGAAIGCAVYNPDKTYKRRLNSQYVFQEGDEGCWVRYTFAKSNKAIAQVEVGTSGTSYEPYTGRTVINPNILPSPTLQNIKISLPDKIYAVVGDTLQIFWRGILKCFDPYMYNVLVSCSKGNQYTRYFQYTPESGDIGTTTFRIRVKDNNGVVLGDKSCQLVTVASPVSPSNQINIACFGDSLTSGGVWCKEAWRRLTQSGGTPQGSELTNISFVGSKNNKGCHFFGEGGWSWASYVTEGRPAFRFYVNEVITVSYGAVYSNNGYNYTVIENNSSNGNILCSVSSSENVPSGTTLTKVSGNGPSSIIFSSFSLDSQNPLWDYTNNKMSFIPYVNNYCGGQLDVVYTLLSWNAQTPWKEDFSSIISMIKTFADTLHAEYPNAKLKIMGIQIPSVTGGMGASYGAGGTGYADGYGNVITALNQNDAYQKFANSNELSGVSGDAYNTFIEFVNVSSQFDSDYLMPYSEVPVNTRLSTVTEMRGTNGVHPSTDGYNAIGDIVYRNIVANFCQ